MFNITVSTGSIQSWIKQLSSDKKKATEKIRERISHLRVLNCDENENWSYLALHKMRGSKAMDEMDILPGFRNTMISGSLTTSTVRLFTVSATHILCRNWCTRRSSCTRAGQNPCESFCWRFTATERPSCHAAKPAFRLRFWRRIICARMP